MKKQKLNPRGTGRLTLEELGRLQVRLNSMGENGPKQCLETRKASIRALPMIEEARSGRMHDGQMYGVRPCGCQMSFDELWRDPAMVLTTCGKHPDGVKEPKVHKRMPFCQSEGARPRA